MSNLLLVDIGGTNMRHAISSSESNEITNICKTVFADMSEFEDKLENLIKENNIDELICYQREDCEEPDVIICSHRMIINGEVIKNSSAVATAGASRLSDFQAAKSVGGRNATSGKISAGYIAGKSSALSKFNTIVDAQISKVTTSRSSFTSGTRMYVALTNLINVLTARKTEYAAKWDYATAIYNDNSSAKTTARNAIIF